MVNMTSGKLPPIADLTSAFFIRIKSINVLQPHSRSIRRKWFRFSTGIHSQWIGERRNLGLFFLFLLSIFFFNHTQDLLVMWKLGRPWNAKEKYYRTWGRRGKGGECTWDNGLVSRSILLFLLWVFIAGWRSGVSKTKASSVYAITRRDDVMKSGLHLNV